MKKVTRTQDCPVTFFMTFFMTRLCHVFFKTRPVSDSFGTGLVIYCHIFKNRCLPEETAERGTHHSFMVLINMIRAFLWEGESRSQH